MKIVRIGNYQYRAKHIGKYAGGNDKYALQFRPVLFEFIPLSWDRFYSDYTLEEIESYLRQKMQETDEIADLKL
jgi:hypothetical protein